MIRALVQLYPERIVVLLVEAAGIGFAVTEPDLAAWELPSTVAHALRTRRTAAPTAAPPDAVTLTDIAWREASGVVLADFTIANRGPDLVGGVTFTYRAGDAEGHVLHAGDTLDHLPALPAGWVRRVRGFPVFDSAQVATAAGVEPTALRRAALEVATLAPAGLLDGCTTRDRAQERTGDHDVFACTVENGNDGPIEVVTLGIGYFDATGTGLGTWLHVLAEPLRLPAGESARVTGIRSPTHGEIAALGIDRDRVDRYAIVVVEAHEAAAAPPPPDPVPPPATPDAGDLARGIAIEETAWNQTDTGLVARARVRNGNPGRVVHVQLGFTLLGEGDRALHEGLVREFVSALTPGEVYETGELTLATLEALTEAGVDPAAVRGVTLRVSGARDGSYIDRLRVSDLRFRLADEAPAISCRVANANPFPVQILGLRIRFLGAGNAELLSIYQRLPPRTRIGPEAAAPLANIPVPTWVRLAEAGLDRAAVRTLDVTVEYALPATADGR